MDNNILIFVLFTCLLIWIIREVIFTLINNMKISSYKHTIRTEKTREYFANLRQELLDLVKEDKINPNSYIFEQLYRLYTSVMRRPDEYKKISELLLFSLTDTNKKANQKKQISKTELNEYTRNLLKKTAEGIMMIIVDYSSAFRFLYNIYNKISKTSYLNFMLPAIIQAKKYVESNTSDSTITSLNKGRNGLTELSMA